MLLRCLLILILGVSVQSFAMTCEEFTALMMAAHPRPGAPAKEPKSWQEGAIDILENVGIQKFSETVATIPLHDLLYVYDYTHRVTLRPIQNAVLAELRTRNVPTSDRIALFRKVIEEKLEINSVALDALLGLDVPAVCQGTASKIQQGCINGHPVWQYADQMAQTSYQGFHAMMQKAGLKKGKLVVDIGAGFNRLGFYLAIFFPDVRFQGFELLAERVAESKRAAKALDFGRNTEFIQQDLFAEDFSLPVADVYYNWQPVNWRTGEKTWKRLYEIGKDHDFLWFNQGLDGNTIGWEWLERDPRGGWVPRRNQKVNSGN